jgi:hypothetical protein
MVDMFEEKDPPAGVIISPESEISVEIGTPIRLTADVWDSDTEYEFLWVEWRESGNVIAEGSNQTVVFDEPGTYEIECMVADLKEESIIGTVKVEVYKPPLPYDPSNLVLEYEGTSVPLTYEVTTIFGDVINTLNADGEWTNITGLRSSTEEEYVHIEMTLSRPPIPHAEIPMGSSNGEWGRYNVFFVRSDFSEPIFDQDNIDYYSHLYMLPDSEECYMLEDRILHLSLEEGCPYEYEIKDNSIIWKVPMKDMSEAGITEDDLNLFGTAVHIKTFSGQMTCSYDTIGHGSTSHNVIVRETEKKDKDEGGSSMGLILIIVIILILLLIGAGIGAFLFLKKKKEDEREEEEDKDEQKEEEPGGETKQPGVQPVTTAPLPQSDPRIPQRPILPQPGNVPKPDPRIPQKPAQPQQQQNTIPKTGP